MSHKCVRCTTIFPNNSPELMRGCTCGSRVFLYLRDAAEPATSGPKSGMTIAPGQPVSPPVPVSIPASLQAPSVLDSSPAFENPKDDDSTGFIESPTRAVSIKVPASDASDLSWLEDELAFLSKDKPVSVDVDAVENLRILEKGAYEIDLPSLFKGEPLVIKSDQHVYYVKLPAPRT